MGTFFTDVLSFQHETAVFDTDERKLRFVYNTYRFTTVDEIRDFDPDLVINAVTLKYTLDAFNTVLPALRKDCIISDIASVKTGLKEFYEQCGLPYVSTHPMFGPTFARLDNLSHENAIIIKEGDHLDASSSRISIRRSVCGYSSIPSTSTTRPWHTRSASRSYRPSPSRPS